MKKPYWQITVDTPRFGTSSSELAETREKALAKFFAAVKEQTPDQIVRLYEVDECGFVRPEYTVTRK